MKVAMMMASLYIPAAVVCWKLIDAGHWITGALLFASLGLFITFKSSGTESQR